MGVGLTGARSIREHPDVSSSFRDVVGLLLERC